MSSALSNLPRIEDQHALNRRRWAEPEADPALASLDCRIETDRFGRIIMMPPPGFSHSDRQGSILEQLSLRMAHRKGRARPECPVSTQGGVKGVDVIWISEERLQQALADNLLLMAPEICVEVASTGNTRTELEEKKRLYFAAGAEEVWICGLEGEMAFFFADADRGESEQDASNLCPGLPSML